MEGLPFLPGNTFRDPTQMKYHVSQTLGYKNGYAIPKRPERGIGGAQLFYNNLTDNELDDLANFNPTLTYGQAKQAPPAAFMPAFVAWDKKVLKFNAYFKQTVYESPSEYLRIRPVDIYYYLEDDSITVIEPHVENSGMPQGKLVNRMRLPKNDQGDIYHWKDLNMGMNITIYGKNFHITNCDKFTKDFLESEGIIVNEPENMPTDPYLMKRAEDSALALHITQSSFDKLKQFKELDHKVLRFFCVWDDRDSMFGDMRPFILLYYLVDDTLEVREVHKANDGRDPFPVLIGRHRVPKDRFNIPSSFPSASMELTEQEIKEYYTPKDFHIGKTLSIYSRRFLIYDCDSFTKAFYYNNFGVTNFDPIEVNEAAKELPKMQIPEYNNYGTFEDTLQNCIGFIPKAPKRDFIKMTDNAHKELRYEAMMVPDCKDTTRPENSGRRFIITYRLEDDMMMIFEPPIRNSGIIGGKFLERTRVAKPGSDVNNPSYYGPEDFYIGAVIEVFRRRFVITNADAAVLKFMEDHKAQFSDRTYKTIKDKIEETGGTKQASILQRQPGDLELTVKQIHSLLKKIAITDKTRIDEMFLKYNRDHTGYIDIKNLRDLCEQLHLPTDEDVLQALICKITKNPEGHISLEDFREFIESM